jgi:tRNA-2-methylthio-N6-dimethylallyladenosine synthase
MSRKYFIETFGCQMNVHDSELMHGVLRSAGLEEAEDAASADVLVLNTCSVREKAEQKLLSLVGRIAKQKRERPDLVLVVAGCVAQQEGERLLQRSRGAIDLVVGPDNLAEIPRLLEDIAGGAPPLARTVFDLDEPRFLASPSIAAPAGGALAAGPTAFVTTMKGCNERCSFCIVPTTRGPERYRSSEEVIEEIAALVDRGVREVTLLGQTVNSYRDPRGLLAAAPGARADDPDESEFAALLRAIAGRVPGLARLRYTSPHPRHLVPSLVRAHAELPVLCRHVHLPVQSGSDRMLKRMIRRYTRGEYLERVARLRAEVQGVTLSTDVIVGFPGETEEDFEATLTLVEEAGFTGLFGFMYSQRPFTPARKLEDDVSEAEKKSRLARLFARSEQQLATHLETLVGTEQQVLIEGLGKMASRPGAAGSWAGRTFRSEIVHLDDPACEGLVGEVVSVRVVRANKHSVAAELDPASQRRGLAAIAARPAGPPRRRALPLLGASLSEGAE